MSLTLSNVRALQPDGGIAHGSIGIERGRIAWFVPRLVAGLDAGGLLALPGIVDLHGDALERQLMPRAGVHFPPLAALIDTDRQLLANGITTAFHGVTLSWEPGLRSVQSLRDLIAGLDLAKPQLGCDTRLHLRLEMLALEQVGALFDWLEQGRIDLLTLNDHSRDIDQHRSEQKLGTYVGRTGLDERLFLDLFDRVCGGRIEAASACAVIATRAQRAGVTLGSHDDTSPLERARFRRLGCRIAEFPVDRATAEAAIAAGDVTVLGAPNVVRGGSHVGRLDANTAIQAGLCSVLASDYYYPALLQAPFTLARRGVMPFGEAWHLVARNPARAVGLGDRGCIAPGLRADLVLVEDRDTVPVAAATLVAGVPSYVAGALAPGLVAFTAANATALAAE